MLLGGIIIFLSFLVLPSVCNVVNQDDGAGLNQEANKNIEQILNLDSLKHFEKLMETEDSGVVEHKEIREKKFDPFTTGDQYFEDKRFDPMDKRFEPFYDYNTFSNAKRFDPYSKRFDPYSKRFDPYSKRFDPYSKRFDPYSKRFDPYSKRFDPLILKRYIAPKAANRAQTFWAHFEQAKRNIIDPKAFQIGLGKR